MHESQALPACSIIIISYNSGEQLPACLYSLYRAFSGIDAEVIVWDNGSPQPLPASLQEDYPQVRWMHSERNLGFGTACNRAAREALHPYLFFVNPDTLVSQDTFHVILRDALQKSDAGVIGCRILNGDGSLQWACRRSFPTPMSAIYKFVGLTSLFPHSRRFGAYNLSYLDPQFPSEVDAVSGSFFCVHRDVYWQVGGFDEDFFLYGEDLDICCRIQKAGFRNYYNPHASIIHFKGQSSRTRMLRSYVDFYQAMLIFARKHPQYQKPIPLWLISLGVFFAAALGVFSRLLPHWFHLLIDFLLLCGLWWAFGLWHGQVWPTWSFLLLTLWTLGPLLIGGEYGARRLAPRIMLQKAVPASLVLLAISVPMLNLPSAFLGIGLLGLAGVWIWRRLYFWFRYFQGVFTGQRRRSLLLGCPAGVSRWFQRENILPGRDLLGCVSAEGHGAARMHYLGSVRDLPTIRARTGARELLLIADRAGRYEALPDLSRMGLRMETRLLIGNPDSGTFALVDLNFIR